MEEHSQGKLGLLRGALLPPWPSLLRPKGLHHSLLCTLSPFTMKGSSQSMMVGLQLVVTACSAMHAFSTSGVEQQDMPHAAEATCF